MRPCPTRHRIPELPHAALRPPPSHSTVHPFLPRPYLYPAGDSRYLAPPQCEVIIFRNECKTSPSLEA
ncbi:hypothetical protein E2C01_057651 [Portunus trituberculatus]|uniref:Uncharacterized protein n=1 Tax=Portunus trituberculatus TaxID=210409 RepID=A0A5B7GXK9_PORTR|nr:hypothetical protein [Portunus trituberculatus]